MSGLIVVPELDMLELATSEERMAPHIEAGLQGLLGNHVSVTSLRIPRVFPKRDGCWSIQFRLTLHSADQDQDLDLILCGILNTRSEQATAQPLDGPTFQVRDAGLEVPLFPYDPLLPGIADFWSPLRLNQDTTDSTGSDPGSRDDFLRPRVLSYKLGRRCTMQGRVKPGERTEGPDPRIIKLVRPKTARKLCEALAHLDRHGFGLDANRNYSVVQIESMDRDKGLLIFERAPGQSLHDLMGTDHFLTGCRLAGTMLRDLHRIPGDTLPSVTAGHILSRLHEQVEYLTPVMPDSRLQLRALLHSLSKTRPPLDRDFELGAQHGDFYDKQILLDQNRATLLDLDTLSAGDPALDVGNFVAHLELRGLQQSESAESMKEGLNAFTEAYDDHGSYFRNRVQWWKAASLLRLAMLYSLRPRWKHLAGPLLDRTDNALQNGEM